MRLSYREFEQRTNQIEHLFLALEEDLYPGPDLLRLLRERHITMVSLTPSGLAALPQDPLPDLRRQLLNVA